MDERATVSEWIAAHRRAVLTAAAILLAILVFARFSWLLERNANGNPEVFAVLRGQIDGLISTIVVSGTLATFFWWFKPPSNRLPTGGEIFPDEISSRLRKAAAEADEWEYVGHTARFVRAAVLPALVQRSKLQGANIKIRAVILDPTCSETCQRYAEYRNRSRSSSIAPSAWTKETVQTELLATIICFLQAKASNPQLYVDIGVTETFSLWRYDRSDKQIIATQEDPQQPAYQYQRGSRFYSYHRQECELTWLQCHQLAINPPVSQSVLDEAEVTQLISRILGRRAKQVEAYVPRAYAISLDPVAPYA